MSKRSTGEINGFLDRNTVVKGELHFTDTMRVDGRVCGKIVSENHLIVGESAEIDADIEVGSITVLGKVKGRLRASDRVEVHTGAVLHAEVTSRVLTVHPGAILCGNCDVSEVAYEANVVSLETHSPSRLHLEPTVADGLGAAVDRARSQPRPD